MQELNAPMTIIIRWRTSEEISLLWDNKYLKMKAINTRSFEKQDNKPFEKTFFIIYVKFKSSQNTLNILREKN